MTRRRTRWGIAVLLLAVIGPVLATAVAARAYRVTPLQLLGHVGHTISRIGLAPAPPPVAAATRDGRWRQDLAYLAEELPRLHANAFHTVEERAFRASVTRLDARIPQLADHEIEIELMRLVALVGDAHTWTWSWTERFHRYPLALRWLDAPYVAATDARHADLLGARVLRFGSVPAGQALEAVASLAPSDSEGNLRLRAQHLLAHAEVWEALGVPDALERGELTVEDADGRTVTVGLEPAASAAAIDWRVLEPIPLYRQRPREPFWLRHVEEQDLVYLRFASCRDAEGFRGVAEEALRLVDADEEARLVVDLRGNGGGDERVMRPLLDGVRARELGAQGRLWALTDAGTFSSAVGNANALRRLGARLAGEPTGGGTDGYGEVQRLTLPNSGIVVGCSTRYWRVTGSEAPLAPDVLVRRTAEDVREGRDPVLEAVVRGGRS